MIILDIDNFKKINDEYGHLAGDMVLKELGDLLVANSRAYDIVCRFGGEEFIIVMPGIDRTAACERAESLRVSFETLEIKYEANTIRATISLGETVFPDDGPDRCGDVSRADRALYQASIPDAIGLSVIRVRKVQLITVVIKLQRPLSRPVIVEASGYLPGQ
jgi:diguanylate cyclase (GGDEF)-like protein